MAKSSFVLFCRPGVMSMGRKKNFTIRSDLKFSNIFHVQAKILMWALKPKYLVMLKVNFLSFHDIFMR